MPDPGIPTVRRVPLPEMLTVAPGPPSEVLRPDLLILSLIPGKIFSDFRKRNPTADILEIPIERNAQASEDEFSLSSQDLLSDKLSSLANAFSYPCER